MGGESVARPLIVIDPQPRSLEEILEPNIWARLEHLGELAIHEGPGRMPADRFESYLPDMALLIGQSDMPKVAPRPRAEIARHHQCRDELPAERRLRSLLRARHPCSRAGLGLRQAGRGDDARNGDRPLPGRDRTRIAPCARARRSGCSTAAEGCFSLYGARVGPHRLRRSRARLRSAGSTPFGCPVKAYDPWVSDHFMAGFGVAAASLEEVLKTSQVIVVFASVTSENQGFLGKREFEMIAPGSVFLLMSRAGVVDFPEFLRQVESGRFRAATDVFPQEPAPLDEPARKVEGLLAVAPSRRRDDAIRFTRSAGRRWPTPASSCAACRRSPAAAPSARQWRALGRSRSSAVEQGRA